MELHIPVDFERLPEFRLLTQALGDFRNNKDANPLVQALQKEIESAATFIFVRLWVELSYLAQTTNQPGLLNRTGAALFEQSLEPLFGEGCEPLELLKGAGVLKAQGEDLFCERFARLNPHSAGNFKSKEVRGAAASALERNRHHIAAQANAQAMLLPPELFKRRDGTPLTDSEVNRCMVLIKTLDNCLKVTGRRNGEYSEGMIADAACAAEAHAPEKLRNFYTWLVTHRDHPRLPKTTEQILAQFPVYFAMVA